MKNPNILLPTPAFTAVNVEAQNYVCECDKSCGTAHKAKRKSFVTRLGKCLSKVISWANRLPNLS